jgi:outer membrane protein assembly factor BamB
MLRMLLRVVLVGIGAFVVVGGVLYQFFGLTVVLDGGGRPRLQFVESAEKQAERIRQHREAQRVLFESVSPAVEQDPSGPAASAVGTGDPAPLPVEGPPVDTRPEVVPPPEVTAAKSAEADPPVYWTEFRGPRRAGRYDEVPLVLDWPASGLKPIWKQPVGGGYASFVAARGRAFTIEQRGPREVVAAYEIATGRELWTVDWNGEFREVMGGDGPRATPAWADGRVYALGALGELRALDEATGRVEWRTNILEDSGATNLPWGMAASPLVVDDLLIVLPGGSNGRSVAAYNRFTGHRAWSAVDDQQSYASPMLVTLGGIRQLVVFSATRLIGLTVDRGELLWEYPWIGPNGINAAQPLLVGDNRIFISSGYGTGAALVEITSSDGEFLLREIWRNTRMKNRFASSVYHDGTIYGLDESILASIDANTGELNWKGGRYGYGQLLLIDDRLIVLTEDGDLALVRATPERHEELVRFPVLNGKTWNVPALDGGHLLVRNLAEMAAFDLRLPAR